MYLQIDDNLNPTNKESQLSWLEEGDESSDTDSQTRYEGSDLQTIFEMDEMENQSIFERSIRSHHKDKNNRPPIGRLRREAPKPIARKQQLEFPGKFIEGFRDGHVGFNIPGILQDSLKPTDSIDVRINLSTPDFFDNQSVRSPNPCISSEITHSEKITAPSSAGFQGNHTEPPYTGRFGLSWIKETKEQDYSAHKNYSLGAFQTSNAQYTGTDPCVTTSIGTWPSDIQAQFSTGSFAISSNPYSSSRFPSVPICEEISNDSGLHSNFGQHREEFSHIDSSEQFLHLSTRFSNFGIR